MPESRKKTRRVTRQQSKKAGHKNIKQGVMHTAYSGTGNAIPAGNDHNPEVDRFEDISVLQYRLPGFDSLPLPEKLLIYYLSEAALCGRDILWDQNFRYNLPVRRTMEAIIDTWEGDRESDSFSAFLTYAKRVFFANGIHHHYSGDKFEPGFPGSYFRLLVSGSDPARLPLVAGETPEQLAARLIPVIFDPQLYARRVDQSAGSDMIAASCNNFYEGVTQAEVEAFYAAQPVADEQRPHSKGLNTKVVKVDGRMGEIVWKSGGMYGDAIDRVIAWLEKARDAALSERQQREIGMLIDFYRSGDLETWDEYNVLWAGNTGLPVDYINGFIETYGDPMGMKATWEAVVQYRDPEASKRSALITASAQWFEDHSPVDPRYRKERVTGVAASVVNVAMLGGDCYPASPLGINLPNSNWIRAEAGSKSVSLANIASARDLMTRRSGFLDEFALDRAEVERALRWGSLADELHTDLHECIGHASGRLAPGTDPNALRNYASPLEEMRADLFALYYIMDPRMMEIGVMPSQEVARVQYDSYMRNGLLTQMARIRPGKVIEQAHMRCRATITHRVYEQGRAGNIVEMVRRDGKSYIRINDYAGLRHLFAGLLREVQRIKSEGDHDAARELIERYGVRIDPQLHAEILARYSALNIAPYTGFVNPSLIPVREADGTISDIKVEYCNDYLGQMMDYGRRYSFLDLRACPSGGTLC